MLVSKEKNILFGWDEKHKCFTEDCIREEPLKIHKIFINNQVVGI